MRRTGTLVNQSYITGCWVNAPGHEDDNIVDSNNARTMTGSQETSTHIALFGIGPSGGTDALSGWRTQATTAATQARKASKQSSAMVASRAGDQMAYSRGQPGEPLTEAAAKGLSQSDAESNGSDSDSDDVDSDGRARKQRESTACCELDNVSEFSEDSDGIGDDDDDDDESAASSVVDQLSHRVGGGLYSWCPGFYDWLQARSTTRGNFIILLGLIVFDCARFMQMEYAVKETVNIFSVIVMASAVSFVIALSASVVVEGEWALKKIFAWQGLSHVFTSAFLFNLGMWLLVRAYRYGLSAPLVIVLSKLYLPVCAVASVFFFARRYSSLEWLAMGMLMLGVTAFVLLRYQCHVNRCRELEWGSLTVMGLGCMLGSVCAGAPASLIMERIYKRHMRGGATKRDRRNKYLICRAQLDFWMTIIFVLCWVALTVVFPNRNFVSSVVTNDVDLANTNRNYWFGHWTKRHYGLAAIIIAQSWLAGLVVQRFSTVSKGVAQMLATVLTVMLGDPLLGKYDFSTRFMPSLLITIIVVLSALIFQTGRINVKAVRRLLSRQKAKVHFNVGHIITNVRDRIATRGDDKAHAARAAARKAQVRGLCAYSTIILYILADSFRSEIMYVVQANRFFVPQTMAVMSAVCGVSFASVMTLRSFGVEGLRTAWSLEKIRRFLICGALQAMTTSLSSMAYALGTSPALVVALGKVYTPLVAVFSRCILGKHFMWLEWFALIILTAASFAFGILQDLTKHNDGAGLAGALCVIASAASSCLMSLLMEKILKTERDPFIMQKVRLDFGSVLFSTLFLPIMGALGTMPGNRRTDVAFWVKRSGPDFWACQAIAMDTSIDSSRGCDQSTGEFLANMTIVGNSSALLKQIGECDCGSGILLGWGSNYMIYVGLAAVVFHSWITGVLVSQFSSVYRAVADGVPVVLIYFFLDPVFSRIPLDPFRSAYSEVLPFPPSDLARDCLCLILPLSGTTFSVASSEMQKVADLDKHDAEEPEGTEQEKAMLEEVEESSDEASTESSN